MPETIREYGCTICQRWHAADDPLYERHLMHQSKHGWRERPLTDQEKHFAFLLSVDKEEEAGRWEKAAWMQLFAQIGAVTGSRGMRVDDSWFVEVFPTPKLCVMFTPPYECWDWYEASGWSHVLKGPMDCPQNVRLAVQRAVEKVAAARDAPFL
jgi:hypothetical protein